MAIDVYTQGNKWEMAVAVPVTNSRLLYPTLIQSEFNGAYTTGTSINLSNDASVLTNTKINAKDSSGNLVNVLHLQNYASANDSVKFGPSSDASFSGTVEQSYISNLSGDYTIIIPSELSTDFSAGDNIYIIADKFPAGWYFNTNTVDYANISNTGRVRGRLSNYAFEWTYSNDTSGAEFNQYLNADNLFGTTYRYGLWARGSRTTSDAENFAGMVLVEGSSGVGIVSFSDSDLDSSAWKMMTATGTATGTSDTFYVRIYNGDGNDGTQTDVLGMDEIFVEHSYIPNAGYTVGSAYNNGGTDTITNNGYFEFSDPDNSVEIRPDVGSIRIDEYESETRLRLLNASLKTFDLTGLGQRTEKYIVSCTFTSVPKSFYKILKEYERIQKDGHSLNFHPYMDELPSTLTGKMILGKPQHDANWDLDLVSFDFQFMEE